jgi:hypothetical protein
LTAKVGVLEQMDVVLGRLIKKLAQGVPPTQIDEINASLQDASVLLGKGEVSDADVVLGAMVIFATVLIKDNIAEGIRSNIQAVEFAKQFYELHIEDIDLNSRLNEVGDSVEELNRLVSKKDVPNALQEIMNTALQNHNEAVKNAKLIQAANADTEELVRRVGDSTFFFTYSDGEERILRSDLKLSRNSLESLRSDITL